MKGVKPFVKVCESEVLRRSVIVCCGAKAELEKLLAGASKGYRLSKADADETWGHLEGCWADTIDGEHKALGFTTRFHGDVFVVLPEWDSRVFVHEAYHAARLVLKEASSDDEELGAYLIEWLFEKVCWCGCPGGKKGRK